MGKKYGIKTPIIDSMIHLANVMTESNYFETGFTLEDIGIEAMSLEQIQMYLREGCCS
jgi:opine dehydrogenase